MQPTIFLKVKSVHCIDPHPIHSVHSSLKVEKPQLGRHAHEGPPSSFCVWIPLNLFDSEEPLNFGTYLESDLQGLQGNQCARTFSRVPWESFRTSGPGSILCFYLSVLWRAVSSLVLPMSTCTHWKSPCHVPHPAAPAAIALTAGTTTLRPTLMTGSSSQQVRQYAIIAIIACQGVWCINLQVYGVSLYIYTLAKASVAV